MIDVQWGQTKGHLSWHIYDLRASMRSGRSRAVCGQRLDVETLRDNRPGNEKTCENCLRIRGPK